MISCIFVLKKVVCIQILYNHIMLTHFYPVFFAKKF